MRYVIFSIPFFISINSHASLSILLYHNIGDKPLSTSITEDKFTQQMDYLSNNHFIVLHNNELEQKLLSGFDFSNDKYIAITFDNGWKSQKKAAKILSDRKLPAVFFMNGEPIENKYPAFLSVQDLIDLSNNPLFTIADHSYSHRAELLLPGGQTLVDDYEKNQKFLNKYIPNNSKTYAYPYGYLNSNYTKFLLIKNVKIIHGVKQRKIFNSGVVKLTDLPRFVINNTISFEKFNEYIR